MGKPLYLSHYIKSGNLSNVKELSKVTDLNEKAAEDVESYSGFITTNSNQHNFFWFFKAESNPEDKPLIVWLQVSTFTFKVHKSRLSNT